MCSHLAVPEELEEGETEEKEKNGVGEGEGQRREREEGEEEEIIYSTVVVSPTMKPEVFELQE